MDLLGVSWEFTPFDKRLLRRSLQMISPLILASANISEGIHESQIIQLCNRYNHTVCLKTVREQTYRSKFLFLPGMMRRYLIDF